jgi:hypothetical protein
MGKTVEKVSKIEDLKVQRTNKRKKKTVLSLIKTFMFGRPIGLLFTNTLLFPSNAEIIMMMSIRQPFTFDLFCKCSNIVTIEVYEISG